MVGLVQNYRDAMALLDEARDYATGGAAAGGEAASPFERLQATLKAMEVTGCLADIAAWLMSRRAMEVGEISFHQAREGAHRLSPCLIREPTSEGAVRLPQRLELLIGRTLMLHRRLDRLNRLLDGNPTKTPFA